MAARSQAVMSLGDLVLDMAEKLTVVTSGVGSEYVLDEISAYLRGRSCQVHEFDFAQVKENPEDAFRRLARKSVVFITSTHSNLTREVALAIAPWLIEAYPNYLSPLEIIPLLRPRTTIYIPHDLLSPYGESNLSEWRFLDLYDHILTPFRDPVLEEHCGIDTQLHDAGWVKFNEEVAKRTERRKFGGDRPLKVAIFPSFIVHLMTSYGPAGAVDYLRPLLGPGVQIKLPNWHGVELIEQVIAETTEAELVSNSANSTEMILQSDIVICNGASSIVAEASLLGIPAICLLDDESEPAASKREKLSAFPQVHFHDYAAREPIDLARMMKLASDPPACQLKPFSFQKVFDLVAGS